MVAVRFLHVATPHHATVCKSSHPLLVRRGAGLWTDVRPPSTQLLASEIKQSFLSINLACLLAFKQQAAGPLPHPPPPHTHTHTHTHARTHARTHAHTHTDMHTRTHTFGYRVTGLDLGFKSNLIRGLPGGPVAKALWVPCRWQGFDLWLETSLQLKW